jgi:hypothetical protein
MSKRHKGRLPPFVPLIKETMKTPAWIAMSLGAKMLYVHLKWRYNTNLQNHVYLSTRMAAQEIGSDKHQIRRWFRELQYYGFTVMVRPGGIGVEGRGKAPHWRLTEEWYLGKPPTRDFLLWDGEVFRVQKSPKSYLRKIIEPGGEITPKVGVKSPPYNRTKVGVKSHP